MKKILLTVPKSVLRQFRKQALEAFPVETCAFLIGTERQTRARRYVEVKELWRPPEVWDEKAGPIKNQFCTPHEILLQDSWLAAAQEYATEATLEFVGCVHSHPWLYRDLAGRNRPDCAESEADENYFKQSLSGICLVIESKSGRKRVRFRFWGPRAPVEMATVS